MPNWVKNIVTFKGNKDVLRKIYEYTNDFNLNNFVPMPETINISCSTETDNAQWCYLNYMFSSAPVFSFPEYFTNLDIQKLKDMYDALDKKEVENLSKILLRYSVKGEITKDKPFGDKSVDISYLWTAGTNKMGGILCRGDFIELGKIACENIIKYGSNNWYDWSLKNWGTKWNINNCTVFKSEFEIYYDFETAWSVPYKIVEFIFDRFKDYDVEIMWKFADEDIGSNSGYIEKKKESVEYNFVNVETIEFANSVWGYEDI